MVTITAPNSQVMSRSDGVRVAWEPEYPQSAYEILYRRKGEETWNTCGRVEGAAHEAELGLERFDDFAEYHYRVVCYSDDAADGTTVYDGNDSSAAYSLVVVPENRLASVKIKYGDRMVEVPIYAGAGTENSIKTALPSGAYGEIPVGDADDALASELRVNVNGRTKAALGSEGRFAGSGVEAGAYMAVKSRYQYSYANPTYSYKYRYSYTNPTYTYKYRYSTTSAVYYYRQSYNYTTPVTYSRYSYRYTASAAAYGYYKYLSYGYEDTYLYEQVTVRPYTYYAYATEYASDGIINYVTKRYAYLVYKEVVSPTVYGYWYYYRSFYAYGKYYTPATYAYSYGYTKSGGDTAYGYKYTSGGGVTSYGYRYSSGGGGTGYGYRYTTGGGETEYGYRYRTEYRYQ